MYISCVCSSIVVPWGHFILWTFSRPIRRRRRSLSKPWKSSSILAATAFQRAHSTCSWRVVIIKGFFEDPSGYNLASHSLHIFYFDPSHSGCLCLKVPIIEQRAIKYCCKFCSYKIFPKLCPRKQCEFNQLCWELWIHLWSLKGRNPTHIF